MLLDYVPGGELFTYMRKKMTFDLKSSLFYISEITLAFEYLHSLQIVYRRFIELFERKKTKQSVFVFENRRLKTGEHSPRW